MTVPNWHLFEMGARLASCLFRKTWGRPSNLSTPKIDPVPKFGAVIALRDPDGFKKHFGEVAA